MTNCCGGGSSAAPYVFPSLDLWLLAEAGRYVWQGRWDHMAALPVDELMLAMGTDQLDVAQAMPPWHSRVVGWFGDQP